jgi:hypothetical protein
MVHTLAVMAQALAGKPSLPPLWGGEQVVIVDDNPELVELVRKVLGRGGYEGVTPAQMAAPNHFTAQLDLSGDLPSAERLAVAAAEGGDASALYELAVRRERRGDRISAERLARTAADYGDTTALERLAAARKATADRDPTDGTDAKTANSEQDDQTFQLDLTAATPAGIQQRPAEAQPNAGLQCATLLEITAEELGALHARLVDQPPTAAGERLLLGCGQRLDRLTQAVEHVWAALSDFRGADLRPVTGVSVEELDGIHWSDGTADGKPTQWPDTLVDDVEQHSARVDGQPDVWEIRSGATVSPRRRP